jgi:hypothetical protein
MWLLGYDRRRWFGEAAHLGDEEIWQAELKAARRAAAAAAARAAEEAIGPRPSWRRNISRAIRRMLRRKR